MENSLLKKLIKYRNSTTPFHMPGHKRAPMRSPIPYSIDITEVDGFDNLHDMQGILKETAKLAQTLYKSCVSFPLVNGSTCGVLAGIYSLTRENKNILIARNCHKSVYNATEILDLNAHYVLPESCEFGIWGEVSAEDIEKEILTHNIGTVVITSPTYEGVVSDIPAIYEICKKHGAHLFIDSAHGAHLPDLHRSCDICVMSLHKTMPSLTQTALLNVYSKQIDLDIVKHALSMFETSSPSYVLLASIDECLRYALTHKGDFDALCSNLNDFYEKTKNLKNIKVLHFDDLGKIIIASGDAKVLAQRLKKEKIEVEMVSQHYVLAMATVADTKRSLNLLKKALFKIDKDMKKIDTITKEGHSIPNKELKISDALKENGEFLNLEDAVGKVSLEYIFAYPPGAPIVVPGELICEEIADLLKSMNDLKSTKGCFPKIYVK